MRVSHEIRWLINVHSGNKEFNIARADSTSTWGLRLLKAVKLQPWQSPCRIMKLLNGRNASQRFNKIIIIRLYQREMVYIYVRQQITSVDWLKSEEWMNYNLFSKTVWMFWGSAKIYRCRKTWKKWKHFIVGFHYLLPMQTYLFNLFTMSPL